MYLLTISLYEFGQFLRIVLWIFVPLFAIVLLITTYVHHRRKRQIHEVVLEGGELLVSAEPIPYIEEQPDEDNLYKGLLWMKQKFEEYRIQSDDRVGLLKVQLDERTATIESLKEELSQSREKIADLTGKLENNMSLLMNIHKELDKSLVTNTSLVAATLPASTPEAAIGGPGSDDLAQEH